MVVLFHVHTFENLQIEEDRLQTEFHFYNVHIARNNFKSLVLAKMKHEAKSSNVDLKPYYADQAYLYNSACFEGEFYSPISSPPRSPQLALADHAHYISIEKTLSAPHSPTHDLEVVQPRPSNSTDADLAALKKKIMAKVQVELEKLMAKLRRIKSVQLRARRIRLTALTMLSPNLSAISKRNSPSAIRKFVKRSMS